MKNIIREIQGMFRVLFNPSCWVQVKLYSSLWDKQLTEAMEKYAFTPQPPPLIRKYENILGPWVVWTANHPYGSMTRDCGGNQVRPRRITILRAFDKLVADSSNWPV